MMPTMLMTDLRVRPWLRTMAQECTLGMDVGWRDEPPSGILWYDEPPEPGAWLATRLRRYHARYQDMAQTLGPRPLLAAALETT